MQDENEQDYERGEVRRGPEITEINAQKRKRQEEL